MEKLRERDVVATRFWKTLLQIAPKTPAAANLTYSHAFLLLFLYAIEPESRLSQAIVRQIWSKDDPGASNSVTDEELRTRSIYQWLMSASPQTYFERIGRAYRAASESLKRTGRDDLGFMRNNSWLAEQRHYVNHWLANVDRQHILDTFDHGIAAVVKSTTDVERERFAANLLASLVTNETKTIGDFFGATGHFAIAALNNINTNFSYMLGRLELSNEILAMRMHLQNIRIRHIERESVNDADYVRWPTRIEFLLLNPTPRGEGGKASQPPEDTQRDTWPPTAIGLIGELCRGHAPFKFALVIVPHTDCLSTRWQRAIRRELVETGRVAAVVDIPKSASDVRRIRFSAWLIRGDLSKEALGTGQILFIDAEPLSLLSASHESPATSLFVGSLLAGIIGDIHTQFKLLSNLEESEPLLAKIFSREFSPDHYDAAGLSRSVRIDEVRERDFALTSSAYVAPSIGSTWLRGLDRRLLDNLLEDRQDEGKRMYIIGNNGEGKSILLRDIAIASSDAGRKTVAIAFGAADRFPHGKRKNKNGTYKYMGARTTATAVSALKTAVETGKLMVSIYNSPERLRVFDEIAHLVGFTSEQFLIPRQIKRNAQVEESLIGGIVRLASQSTEDRELVDNLRRSPELLGNFKLGLRRAGDHDGIVPFDELSSGEQQIILLATKIVSEAESGMLFVVDEPEISLHVSWQRALPQLFSAITRSFDLDILVATHSPVVIASADSDRDYCFTIRDRALVSLSPEDRRSVETTLFEGFRTYTVNNREVHERCASLVADFMDKANQKNREGDPEKIALSKLEDMKQVVRGRSKLDETEDVLFDIRLIERAQAAIQEIATLRANSTFERG